MSKFTCKQKLLSVFIVLFLAFTTISPVAFADLSGDVPANTTSDAPGFTISSDGLVTQEILDEINSEFNFDDYALPNSISTQNFSTLNTLSNLSSNGITQELLDEINSELDLDEYIEAYSAQLNAQLLADIQSRPVTMNIGDIAETNMVGVSAPVVSLDSVGDYFVGVTWTPAVFVGSSSQILYDVYVNGSLYETTEYTVCGGIAIGHDTDFSIYVKAYLEDNPSVYVDSNTVTDRTDVANPPNLKPVILDNPVVSGTSITLNWHEDTSSTYESAGYFGVLVIKDDEFDSTNMVTNNSYTYTGLQADSYYEFYIMSGYMYYGFIDTTNDFIPFYNGNSYFLTQPVISEDFVTDYFVGISWTPAYSVALNAQVEYEIYLNDFLYDTVSYTSYSGIGVGVGSYYDIYVKAVVVYDANKSITSVSKTGHTLEGNPPELKPIIFDQPVVNGTSITLNWHEDSTSSLTSADYMAVIVIKDDEFGTTYSVSGTAYTYTNLQPDVYYKFIVLSGYMYYGFIQDSGEAVPFYNGNADFLTLPVINSSVTGRYVQLDWTDAISVHPGTVCYEVFMNGTSKGVVEESCMNNIAVLPGEQYSFYVVASISVDGVNKTITSDAISIDPSLIGSADTLVIDTVLGEHVSVVVSAVNLPANDSGTVALRYDSTKLGLVDLCLLTYDKELSPCTIADMGITIVSVDTEDGEIVFSSPNLYDGYTSKLLNALEFVGLVSNEQTTITIE